ncbi:MAG: DUF2281 domain-containing protein [Thermodesulfovibrionales bacterium]|nr:DUF2281 domain-containing protein [Thermodesulfovibrionales bacterium]
MKAAKIIEILETLPEERQAEVIDFINFLKHQIAKDRILASDKEERIGFDNVDALMKAIDNAD